MERRKSSRYAYKLKAKVQSVESKSLANPIETWTRDVNSKGLALNARKRLAKGTRVQVALQLPPEVTGRPVLLWCVCRVVRVSGWGVGVVIESYEHVAALADK